MHQFRVTKYNPTKRTNQGHFTQNEWISFSDIGREFDGCRLTISEYERVENAYIEAAIRFLNEADIDSLTVCGLENNRNSSNAPKEADVLSISALRDTLRALLREEFWCRLECPSAFIHIGWDYYMYVGVPSPCEASQAKSRSLGLFVEVFDSPYFEGDT